MTGFHVFFNDDALEEVVHIQAWTLGLGETVSKSVRLYGQSLDKYAFYSTGSLPYVVKQNRNRARTNNLTFRQSRSTVLL